MGAVLSRVILKYIDPRISTATHNQAINSFQNNAPIEIVAYYENVSDGVYQKVSVESF
jgi:hypothetical protein